MENQRAEIEVAIKYTEELSDGHITSETKPVSFLCMLHRGVVARQKKLDEEINKVKGIIERLNKYQSHI